MIRHQGIWLPDGETHLTAWMDKAGEIVDGKGTYQIKKLRAALARCRSFRTAVDVGAHVGMWSMQLAKRFQRVEAFEPVPEHRACFDRNMLRPYSQEDDEGGWYAGVSLHACALGDHEGLVRIDTAPTSSGDSKVGGPGDIRLCTLDSFNLHEVDFIKLDCEGYEYFALKGGEATIRRDGPTIIVEQKPGRGQQFGLTETAAVDWLKSLGYHCAEVLAGDYIMVRA